MKTFDDWFDEYDPPTPYYPEFENMGKDAWIDGYRVAAGFYQDQIKAALELLERQPIHRADDYWEIESCQEEAIEQLKRLVTPIIVGSKSSDKF